MAKVNVKMNKPCPNCGSENVEVFNTFLIHDFNKNIIKPAEFCDAICIECNYVYPFTRLYDSIEEYKTLNSEG